MAFSRAIALIVCALATLSALAADVGWPFYGGDQGGSKYSALTQINRANVSSLKLAWEWRNDEKAMANYGTHPGLFEATPILARGMLYMPTPYNRVVALDPVTGQAHWTYDPKAYEEGQVPNGTGFVHRGIAYWADEKSHAGRILLNSRSHLIELDADTGKLVPAFGDNGVVNLLTGLAWSVDPKQYTNTSPPVIYHDLVIVGNGVADRFAFRKDPPGDVRAYNARSGKLAWTFHTVPRRGEVGSETWEKGANEFTGHTNVWAPMTLDENRGLLYMPVSTQATIFMVGAGWGRTCLPNRWFAWTRVPVSASGTTRLCITGYGITTCHRRRI